MKKYFVFALSLMILCSSALFAITGKEVAQNAKDRDMGDSVHMLIKMELIDKNGAVNSRIVETWGMEEGEDDLNRMVMIFHEPASVKNTRFLVAENKNRDDDKFIYLPALKKVRRIAASEGSSSFMGTDMTYDDMGTRDIEQDSHDLIKEEKYSNYDCYVVKAVSVDPDDSQYSQRITWFDKATWVPVKIELYDKKGKMEKVMDVSKMEKVQGYWSVLETSMKNVQTGHSTKLTVGKLLYNEKLNPRLFTPNFLQTGRVN